MTDKQLIEIASLRLALISPALNDTYTEPSKAAYYRRIAANHVVLPDGTKTFFRAGTLACWESQYKRFGFDSLIPQQRSDAGKSRKLTADTIARIYHLKEQFPRINATILYHKLIEDGFIDRNSVSLSTIQRFIKRNDLKSAKGLHQKDRKAFEEEFACGLFQADTLHGPYIVENGFKRKTYLIMILDDKTRMIVGGRFFYHDNSYNFQKVLKGAVATYGIPDKIYVDNGSPYKNEQISLICGSLGSVLIHAPVRDGASKGKVERNFRTLRSRFLNILHPEELSSLDELNSKLTTYIGSHNTTIHSATNEAPMNRYKNDINRIKCAPSMQWLDEVFLNRIKRRVNNDSTISIDRISYDVPMQFIGQKVDVRYLPDDMDHAFVLYDHVKYKIRKTNKIENGRTRRDNTYQINYSGGNP